MSMQMIWMIRVFRALGRSALLMNASRVSARSVVFGASLPQLFERDGGKTPAETTGLVASARPCSAGLQNVFRDCGHG